jgi:acyl carrier protein
MSKQDQVIEILAKIANKEKSNIKPEHELVADLGLDSQKQLQLLIEMEAQLKIEIDDETAARMQKVGDILQYVGSKN